MRTIYTLARSSKMLRRGLVAACHLDSADDAAIFIISDIKNNQKPWCLR
jgi:hypothetical protein